VIGGHLTTSLSRRAGSADAEAAVYNCVASLTALVCDGMLGKTVVAAIDIITYFTC